MQQVLDSGREIIMIEKSLCGEISNGSFFGLPLNEWVSRLIGGSLSAEGSHTFRLMSRESLKLDGGLLDPGFWCALFVIL